MVEKCKIYVCFPKEIISWQKIAVPKIKTLKPRERYGKPLHKLLKMRKIIFLLSLLLITSCKSIESPSSVFNDSNEINFYRVTEKSEDLLSQDSIKVPRIFSELIFINRPLNLPNESELKSIEKYYKNIVLSKKSSMKITKIFDDAGFPLNKASFEFGSICEPVYRDILIFKQEGRIIAYAKICLSCYQNYVVVEKNRFENFVIEYKELHKLLDSLASQ